MKSRLVIVAICMGVIGMALGKDLKVLMIGNSFSICVGNHLPSMVNSVPGNHLLLASAYIGGCDLERHWNNAVQAKDEPDFKPYQVNIWDSSIPLESTKFKDNVNHLLTLEPWDIVTIQQASHFSWRPETYEPFAAQLIAFVREKAPQAEIVIQQTWAYRASDPRISEGGAWGVDQEEMHNRLADAYAKLAETYHLRVIPTGRAVRIFRQEATPLFAPPTKKQLEMLRWPDLPPQALEVVGHYYWSKREDKMVIASDDIHLNGRGEYLQACVWFVKLFGQPANNINYDPAFLDADDTAFLKKCAQKAVDEYIDCK